MKDIRIVVLHSRYSSTTILVVKGGRRLFIINKGQINVVKVVAVIAAVAMLLFIWIIVIQNIRYSEFVKVESKIINLSTKSGTKSKNKMTFSHIITYEYEYEGKTYSASKQVFSKAGKKIGTFEVIRCNPNNPQEIENTLLTNVSLACAIFFGVISLALIFGICQYYNDKKKNRYVRYE